METPPSAPASPPASQLGALREGTALLFRHPAHSLGLLVLAVLLGQLGPALELLAKTGNSLWAQFLFARVALLPLELYALPRWLSRLDAEAADDPSNPREGWLPGFETRWLRASLAYLLLFALGGLGCLLILPGLLLFFFFGWAPIRMLLRGDPPSEALRWSGRTMLRFWPRIVQAALAVMAVGLLGVLLSVQTITAMLPAGTPENADALLRLRHPAFWLAGSLAGLVSLWSGAAFLALYHRLEKLVQSSESR